MKAKGFTLIEVLLAMMLLSIVMYIGSLSFSVFSERWSKELGGFNRNVDNARKLALLREVVSGATNYLALDKNNRLEYLFLGDTHNLKFVSRTPLYNEGTLALVSLTVQSLDNGQQQLIYSERRLLPVVQTDGPSLSDRERTSILLQSDNIRFNYFGWRSLDDRDDYLEASKGKPEWQSQYTASDNGMLPYAINITWAQNEPLIFPIRNDNRFKTIFFKQDDAYEN